MLTFIKLQLGKINMILNFVIYLSVHSSVKYVENVLFVFSSFTDLFSLILLECCI